MAIAPGPATDLGSLFVEITGRATVVERQHVDVPLRVDDGAEHAVAAYVDASTRANGLDDAIDDPGPD